MNTLFFVLLPPLLSRKWNSTYVVMHLNKETNLMTLASIKETVKTRQRERRNAVEIVSTRVAPIIK